MLSSSPEPMTTPTGSPLSIRAGTGNAGNHSVPAIPPMPPLPPPVPFGSPATASMHPSASTIGSNRPLAASEEAEQVSVVQQALRSVKLEAARRERDLETHLADLQRQNQIQSNSDAAVIQRLRDEVEHLRKLVPPAVSAKELRSLQWRPAASPSAQQVVSLTAPSSASSSPTPTGGQSQQSLASFSPHATPTSAQGREPFSSLPSPGDIASLQLKLKASETRMSTLEDEVRRQQASNEDLRLRVDALNSQVSSQEFEIARKQRLLQVAESKISKLRKRSSSGGVGDGDSKQFHGGRAEGQRAITSLDSLDRHSLKEISELCGSPLLSFYEDFEERFFDELAQDVKQSVHSFIRTLISIPQTSRAPGMVQNFLRAMEATLRRHQLWRDCDESELDDQLDGFETYILSFPGVSDCLYGLSADSRQADASLQAKLESLWFVQLHHLDLPAQLRCSPFLVIAINELCSLSEVQAPAHKIEIIFRTCQIILTMLSKMSETMTGADMLLPTLIFVILKAKPDRLKSMIGWVEAFRRPQRLSGEKFYYFTQFFSALSFLEHCTAQSFSALDPSLWNACHPESNRYKQGAGRAGNAEKSVEHGRGRSLSL